MFLARCPVFLCLTSLQAVSVQYAQSRVRVQVLDVNTQEFHMGDERQLVLSSQAAQLD